MTQGAFNKVAIEKLREKYSLLEARSLLQCLLMDYFDIKRHELGVLDQEDLNLEDAKSLEIQLERVLAGEPVQYVSGRGWFLDWDFEVNPSVLIPRPETEELVMWIVEEESDVKSIIDIGCGSGCIGISLKKLLPEAEIYATDISEAAIETAARNAQRLGVPLLIRQHDILGETQLIDVFNKEIKDGVGVELIVSNPPYISPEESTQMSKEVLEWEPSIALFSIDPLAFYRAIAIQAKESLASGGRIYFEISEFRADAVMELLRSEGYQAIELKADLQGKPRMIRAQKAI